MTSIYEPCPDSRLLRSDTFSRGKDKVKNKLKNVEVVRGHLNLPHLHHCFLIRFVVSRGFYHEVAQTFLIVLNFL